MDYRRYKYDYCESTLYIQLRWSVTGWCGYYTLVDTKSIFDELDE
ncbi:group II intron maturase-specific domain-containing protein [Paenibacillus peoriae]